MRADHRADAVFEGRDDPPAVGVVFRVGRKDHREIEVEPHRVAPDLHVALFQDVEEPDLNLGGQVGELVDAENAAVGSGNQAEMHRQSRWRDNGPSACLIMSTSPIKSAMVTSGVASFS